MPRKSVCSALATLCFAVAASSTTLVRTADLKRSNDAERTAVFESLFNGRDLSGWQVADDADRADWLIHDGAIYCTGERSTLKYTVKKLPRDFELRFRWRTDKPRLFSGLTYSGAGGNVQFLKRHMAVVDRRAQPPQRGLGKEEAIHYGVATSLICVTAVADKIVATKNGGGYSDGLGSLATGSFDRPQGEWNDGSIRCEGTRIECRLNGGLVFEQEASGEAAAKWASGDIPGDWIAAKQGGLELTIDCERSPLWIREIRLCDLTRGAD